MKPKVALAMIVKAGDAEEAKLLDECLKSIQGHVDGIFLQLNHRKNHQISPKIRKIAEKYTKNIKTFIWTGNYVKSRNANFAQVPEDYDWILWLDSDDTLENPEKIREVIAVTPKDTHSIYVQYDYEHDEFGNATTVLWTCRLVRNNGSFAWKSSFDDSEVSVHETLVPKRSVKQGANEEFKVIHHADNARRDRSLMRNIELLEGMYKKQAEKRVDPRILYYLGTHYYDAARFPEAQKLFMEYLQVSGWSEERSEAHVWLGKIFNLYRNPTQARQGFLNALGENPKNQTALLELGKLDASEQRYEQATVWLRQALAIQQGPQAMVLFSGFFELYMLLAECLVELGGKNLSEGLKMADKALKLRPFDPAAQAKRDEFEKLVNYQKNMKAAARLLRGLKDEKNKIKGLLDNLPKDLVDSPVVIGARHSLKEKKVWPKKSIAIYCGNGPLGIWGPWSLEEGIGGSEEAVIRLSQELAKQGWKVTVYATPGERTGEYGGVVWRQFWEFNPDDEFDVLVAWRMPSFFDIEVKARKKYLWLHDVMEKEEFTKERLGNLDKVIVLSEYHKSLFPMLPEDKVFLSANGITPADFAAEDGKYKRDPHRVIYMSSHIRGLALLYDIWPEVKKAVPQATLDIYYGWDSYVGMNHNNPGNLPGGMGWMKMMQAWEKKLDGVTDHGKINHQQIVQEIFKSGVWAYPCPFPEIYCITAIKAQAGGAIPVSSDFAALKETVKYGEIISMKAQDEDTPVGQWDQEDVEKYKKALIKMLLYPEKQARLRKDMMAYGRSQSWQNVAQGWDREFDG